MTRPFRQVDVFSSEPLLGNPVAVVHDADGVTDEQKAAFARWTNLSETTFLLTPTDPAADYRLRIFTPGGELPFAGTRRSDPRTPGSKRADPRAMPSSRNALSGSSRSDAARAGCRSALPSGSGRVPSTRASSPRRRPPSESRVPA
jgi:hypothetical protein